MGTLHYLFNNQFVRGSSDHCWSELVRNVDPLKLESLCRAVRGLEFLAGMKYLRSSTDFSLNECKAIWEHRKEGS